MARILNDRQSSLVSFVARNPRRHQDGCSPVRGVWLRSSSWSRGLLQRDRSVGQARIPAG